jgi:DNA-binding transcriptional ArsR family regulator
LQRYLCDVADDLADPAAVRALAHPLRLELLDLLRFDGPSSATELGRRTGESSGATSYHLRQLARYGFIEEAPARGGRERLWRFRRRRLMLGADGSGGRELLVQLLSLEAHALDRFLAAGEPAEWDTASFFQTRAFRLTADELAELRDGVAELLGRFRLAESVDAPADARPVRFLAFAYPAPVEET